MSQASFGHVSGTSGRRPSVDIDLVDMAIDREHIPGVTAANGSAIP
jgi:hypothetical protein